MTKFYLIELKIPAGDHYGGQGKKWLKIGDEEHHFGESLCFVTGMVMQVSSCVMEASRKRPYLSMSHDLDQILLGRPSRSCPAILKVWPSFIRRRDSAEC